MLIWDSCFNREHLPDFGQKTFIHFSVHFNILFVCPQFFLFLFISGVHSFVSCPCYVKYKVYIFIFYVHILVLRHYKCCAIICWLLLHSSWDSFCYYYPEPHQILWEVWFPFLKALEHQNNDKTMKAYKSRFKVCS